MTTGQISKLGVLDLTSLQSVEELHGITSIEKVGVILIPEQFVAALHTIPMQEVGGIMPIPKDLKIRVYTGQIRLTGDALAAGPEDTTLVIVGQCVICAPVTAIGYRDIRICGQILIPEGGEAVIQAKLSQLIGQTYAYPPGDVRMMVGEQAEWDAAFLSALPAPTTFVMIGSQLTVAKDITTALLVEKVRRLICVGCQLKAPQTVLPHIKALAPDHTGSQFVSFE